MGSKMTQLQILLPGFSSEDLDQLKTSHSDAVIVDIYESQLRELYKLSYPSKEKDPGEKVFLTDKGTSETAGAWVYYPWHNQLLHCVGPDDLFMLRTNRNKLLITEKQQRILADGIVGIAGMSVGAGIALSLVYSGISATIKLADDDVLDTTNLNRLRETLLSVGKPKVELVSNHIHELDPFNSVITFDQGVSLETIDEFFEKPALDIVIDEIDDFKMKIQLRLHAKKYKLPLIMFTSLGDNILVDIERYDQIDDLQPFNDTLGDVSDEVLANPEITPDDIRKYSVSLVGPEYIPTAALESVFQMGTTLVGRPQLYGTITIDSGLAAYVVRRILLGEELPSGRYFISFASLFELEREDIASSQKRDEILNRILPHG